MESFEDTLRQIRIAIVIILTIVPAGIIGFMVIEKLSILDSAWLTVITLATIGYGDVYARTELGRVFTMGLIITGLGAFAYAAQAILGFFLSPEITNIRQRRRTERHISHLERHYIICGEGEMVDKTISYLLQRVETRMRYEREVGLRQINQRIARLLGEKSYPTYALQRLARRFYRTQRRSGTLLDLLVVVTDDGRYANHLRRMGLLVVRGDATQDGVLRRAGIKKARALMVMEDSDTDSLLTVLSARTQNRGLYITAATLEEEFAAKMLRVGANVVLPPFDVAGQFLNNATFRPAVSDFFNTVVFDQENSNIEIVQLFLHDSSPWIGQSLGTLCLRERFNAGVIGIRRDDGDFAYAPNLDYVLAEDEVVLVICPPDSIQAIQRECAAGTQPEQSVIGWQRLVINSPALVGQRIYTLSEAEHAVAEMSSHYIICGGGRVAESALAKLDPNRAFVIISRDDAEIAYLTERGFRVIKGNSSDEMLLKKAGISRALAIMIASDDKALNVLTVLAARTLSKRLLIVATANTDETIPKLYQAGADRVISPFRIAAQFVLMATTRPVVSEFVRHVLFNRQTGLETTELYMEEDTPWIGQQLHALYLERTFKAGIIGIRLANGQFIFAPPADHIIARHEVLIAVTPMEHADELRGLAYGGEDKRPKTIRQNTQRVEHYYYTS